MRPMRKQEAMSKLAKALLAPSKLKPKPTQGNGFVWAGGKTPREVGAASAAAGEQKRLYYGSR